MKYLRLILGVYCMLFLESSNLFLYFICGFKNNLYQSLYYYCIEFLREKLVVFGLVRRIVSIDFEVIFLMQYNIEKSGICLGFVRNNIYLCLHCNLLPIRSL